MNRANSSCNSVMLKDNNFRDNVLDNSVLLVHIFSYLKCVYVVRFENVLITEVVSLLFCPSLHGK